MAPGHTYYDILGLARTCLADEIRIAFRRRALSTHPDKGGNESDFKMVNQAYDVLKDPSSRRLYDACLEADQSSPNSELLQCILNMLAQWMAQWRPPPSGGDPHAPSPPANAEATKPSDILVRLDATLQELYTRAVKKISVKVCGVLGTDKVTLYIPLAGFKGDAYVFSGMGDVENGVRGDIVVKIHPVMPANVRIDEVICNFDLLLDRYITLEEYITADELDVELFPGMVLKVPYKSGSEIAVLERRGLPAVAAGDDDVRGTLYVFFRLLPPTLTDHARATLRDAINELKGHGLYDKEQ